MNKPLAAFPGRLIRLTLLSAATVLLVAPRARAGLTLELNLIRYDPSGYYFSPNLNTNTTPPVVPFGDYYIASLDAPTNGSSALYHFSTNGFNQVGGLSWGYGDFNSMIHELTNGVWSIFVTNSVTTNVYRFTVAANIGSNSMPPVVITFPTNGAVNVTNHPTFTWQGPTNYNQLAVYTYNDSALLPVTQTSWLSGQVLYEGLNSFTAHYDSNSTTAVVSSIPRDNGSNPISSWVSTAHLQDYLSSQFSVGTVDTSGTSHTLVAHYAWDGTNLDGSASGMDASGNGYNMNFGGGFGPQGGANSTTTAAAGPRAIQFHDGDGNSAGYVGWNPTPAGLLTALSGSFSISCWIKTSQNYAWDSAPAYYGAGIVSADIGGQANDTIPLALTGSKIGFNTGGTVEDITLNSVASVNDGNYHHIVVTRNQVTGQKIIYIDGVFDSFSSGTTNRLDAPQALTLGALADASDPDASNLNYYNGYDGLLDDLQIYSGVLSASEAAQLFANPGITADQVITVPLVARYNFENTNSPGTDSSGNGNDSNCGSGNGGTNIDTFSTDAAVGSYARLFGGDTAICFFPNGDACFNNLSNAYYGSFSLSAWVKTTNVVNTDFANAYFGASILFEYSDAINQAIFSITGNKAAFTVGNPGGGSDTTLHSTTTVNDGNYHFIVASRNSANGVMSLYVDGNLEAGGTSTNGPRIASSILYLAGGYNDSFKGLIDDVRVYSGELSARDVATLSGHAPPSDFNTALNTTNLIWTASGESHWFVETTNTHDNVSAAQSGSVTNFQTSILQTIVTGPGTLTFWWQSPSANSLYVQFDLDGAYQDYIGNSPLWSQDGPFTIPPGQHTLSWTVYANGDDDPAEAAFLDEVSFVVNHAPLITLNPFNQTNYPGYNVALLAAATSNAAITWQWFKTGNANPIPNATNALFIPTNSGTAGVAGNYYGVASNPAGSANTSTASVSFVSAPLPPDWSRAFRTPLYNSASDDTTNYNIAALLDSAGNIYTVGSFTGTNAFGSDSLVSATGAYESSFLKQTATGAPIWGRSMTNNGHGSSFAQSVAAAPGDGFYVAGVFSGTNWIGTNRLVDIAGDSTYLARFDANGNNLWVRTIVGTNFNFTTYHLLASDPAGNVTFSALISGSTSFGTSNIYVAGQQGVLAQYDPDGNVQWIQVPSAWPSYLAYSGGRIYGSMGGNSINYIGGVTNVSDRKLALFSINATNGQGLWIRGIGAQQGQNSPTGFGDDNAQVAVSGTNVFVVGSAWGADAVFGPFTVNFPASKGQYLARFDTNGNAQLATSFGSQYTWPWAAVADASGNVYIGADFDTYSFFGKDLIAAPFFETVQFVGAIQNRIPGQTCVAKFDRNGNPLWARLAQSQASYLNSRDIALASDGVWSCGFFNQLSSFGTNTINGNVTCVGSPFCTLQFHPSGYLGKITDSVAAALPVTLLQPQDNGVSFQFQFVSQAGFNHAVQYRTNLGAGSAWQNYSIVAGDGTLKTIPIPLSVFNPAKQGFVRVTTQ